MPTSRRQQAKFRQSVKPASGTDINSWMAEQMIEQIGLSLCAVQFAMLPDAKQNRGESPPVCSIKNQSSIYLHEDARHRLIRHYCATRNSIRRLRERPSAVSLLAIGRSDPWPEVVIRSELMRLEVRYIFTESARAWLSAMFEACNP